MFTVCSAFPDAMVPAPTYNKTVCTQPQTQERSVAGNNNTRNAGAESGVRNNTASTTDYWGADVVGNNFTSTAAYYIPLAAAAVRDISKQNNTAAANTPVSANIANTGNTSQRNGNYSLFEAVLQAANQTIYNSIGAVAAPSSTGSTTGADANGRRLAQAGSSGLDANGTQTAGGNTANTASNGGIRKH
jgi:hypothetical protein